MTDREKTEQYVRNILGIRTKSRNQVGMVPDGSMRDKNGLDEIDLQAARQGSAEVALWGIRPKRKHICV